MTENWTVLKVRVQYTVQYDAEDLTHYQKYNQGPPYARNALRASIRQTLMDIGTMGVDEQIVEGAMETDWPEEEESPETPAKSATTDSFS